MCAVAIALAACGGGGDTSSSGLAAVQLPASDVSALISTSTAPYAKTIDAGAYAAARLLDHASFGPTPAAVARIRSIGATAWVDEQLAMPASRIDPEPVRAIDGMSPLNGQYTPYRFFDLALSAPEQLRLRTTWALSQLLVVSVRRVSGYAGAQYFNLLSEEAFGTYGTLLRKMTVHATMGFFLDNATNQRMGAFPGATANENFARELMQLFTIGLVELNPDGTTRLDARGQPIPTYGQEEVEALARALTGWHYAENNPDTVNFAGFGLPMNNRFATHDAGEKRIVGGRVIPSGGTPGSDLDAVIDALMAHPNTAPFVSHKLIQHLVSGDPSPAYVGRVAAVFRASGGDLKAVVRAIVLDPDARRADQPGVRSPLRGKMKEPVLVTTQVLRAFGCDRLPVYADGTTIWVPQQFPLSADTVFNFYPPSHRVPGTAIVAPEHRLVNGITLKARAGEWGYRAKAVDRGVAWAAAGCDTAEWDAAAAGGEDAAVDLISARLFRGAMPTNVRDAIVVGALRRDWEPERRIYDAVGLATVSPAWGVIK